jgi:predicted HD phosphohydrolase
MKRPFFTPVRDFDHTASVVKRGGNLTDRTADAPGRTPLADPAWAYVSASLEDCTAADLAVLERQRAVYFAERQAADVLRMLAGSADDPSFGYPVNNYRHCLQSATLALRDGLDEETVVVALLHDIGFVASPTAHGTVAAALLGPYISAANHWMLLHHQVFQDYHLVGDPTVDREARERWRGHASFEWTARFVARYDQNAMDPSYDALPLGTFEPMVRRLFARPPRRFSPD